MTGRISSIALAAAGCLWSATANAQQAAAAEPNQSKLFPQSAAEMANTANRIYEFLATKGVDYGLRIIAALLIFYVGKWLCGWVSKLISTGMTKARIEPTLATFIQHLVYVVLLVFVVIAALSAVGVQTAQFIAVVGAAGLAVGLALQGSLANFASGVLLIVFKPFKVGDYVEVAGTGGTVKEMQIFTTVLDTPDNVRVIIPNGQVASARIMNYTANNSRRIDLVIGVSYDDDLKKAKQVIEDVLRSDSRVLKNPSWTVAVSELADSSVNFVVRPWVKPADYWDVYFDMTEKIKGALEKNSITIPFPQQDINIKSMPQKTNVGA